jgi:hypothetical protein
VSAGDVHVNASHAYQLELACEHAPHGVEAED